ncbi:lysophospholipid acyltransferase family protein [bacterium]|nr:lysophospholipid acyltransferase family protein [bacterium]MDA7904942.1 lysophospholipid acyltransferase family protein [Rhodopirellula sp.]
MSEVVAPVVPAWFQNGFHRFLRPFLKRHFHAVAVESESRKSLDFDADEPLLIFANHPSWWDPLIAHFLNRSLFPGRQFYAPIDAEALEQYSVFGKLGFYGVRMNTTSGAAAFLKQTTAILDGGQNAIWITPEGRFADVRDHDAELMPGLAHICKKVDRGVVVPMALEYTFWDERLPVCLAMFGEPVRIADFGNESKIEWREKLSSELRSTQHQLSELVIARSSDPFDDLLMGKAGAGMFYDSVRRVRSVIARKKYRNRHGEQFE